MLTLRRFASPDVTRAFANIVWLGLERLTQIAVAIAISGVLARYFGPDTFGKWQYANTLLLVLSPVTWVCGAEILVPTIVHRPPEQLGTVLGSAVTLEFDVRPGVWPVLVDVTADQTAPILEHAVSHGAHVVLANKRPVSGNRAQAEAIRVAAAAHGRRVLYEATVGAGLPILDTFAKLVEAGDTVQSIEGCPSGTMGYLFGELGRDTPFSSALRSAMHLGYTEPDPRDDLSGADVARNVNPSNVADVIGARIGTTAGLVLYAAAIIVLLGRHSIPNASDCMTASVRLPAWNSLPGMLPHRFRNGRPSVSP